MELGVERLSQGGDVELDDLRRGVRRSAAPDLVDQPVAGDDFVRPQQERGQQRTLPRPAEWNRRVAVGDLERPEDPELHPPLLYQTFTARWAAARMITPVRENRQERETMTKKHFIRLAAVASVVALVASLAGQILWGT